MTGLESSVFRGFPGDYREMDSKSDLSQAPLSNPARVLAGVRHSRVAGDLSRPVVTRNTTCPDGPHTTPHWHARAQYVCAVAGRMRVRTPRRAWIVPPSRALWVPARTAHEIQMHG